MKKKDAIIIIVIVLALGAIYFLEPSLINNKPQKTHTMRAQEEKRAKELCDLMEKKNKEMKAMVHAAISLSEFVKYPDSEKKEIEALFEKLEKAKEPITECRKLVNGISGIEDKLAKPRWHEFLDNVISIATTYLEADRAVGRILSKKSDDEKGV